MEVKVVQTDMEQDMQNLVCDFIAEAFDRKIEYEDIAKYIKDLCDTNFGGEYLCLVVDRYAGFGSCIRCAPGSLFMGDYKKNRIIVFRT